MYGFARNPGRCYWCWFLVVVILWGRNNEALSSSTLLDVAAGILLGDRIEFSGVKILLKVSWNLGLSTSSVASYCSKLLSVHWHLICWRCYCCIRVPFWNNCFVVPISDRVGWKMPHLARLDNIKKQNLSVNKNIASNSIQIKMSNMWKKYLCLFKNILNLSKIIFIKSEFLLITHRKLFK